MLVVSELWRARLRGAVRRWAAGVSTLLLGCGSASQVASDAGAPADEEAGESESGDLGRRGEPEEPTVIAEADSRKRAAPGNARCAQAAARDRESRAQVATRYGKPGRGELSGGREQEYLEVLRAALNYKDFSAFSTQLDGTDRETSIVLAYGLPKDPGITAFGRPVLIWSEEECLREMVLTFFEVVSLKVEGGRATLEYEFPNGAHFGTLTLEQRLGSWQVTNKRALRSSSGRRARLAAYYARKPRPQLPDSDVRPRARELCEEGDTEGCFEEAVRNHNEGRLEKAVDYYEKACRDSHLEACHNRAMLLLRMGGRQEGLCLLNSLCEEHEIDLSCRMYEKYSANPELSPQ